VSGGSSLRPERPEQIYGAAGSALTGREWFFGSLTWGFTPGCNIAGFQPFRPGPDEFKDEHGLGQERAERAELYSSTVLCVLCGLLFSCPLTPALSPDGGEGGSGIEN